MRLTNFCDINIFDNLIRDDEIFTVGFTNNLVIKLLNNEIIEVTCSNDPYFEALNIYILILKNKIYYKFDDSSIPAKVNIKRLDRINQPCKFMQEKLEGSFITCKLYYNKITFFKSNSIFEKVRQNVIDDLDNLFLFLPAFSALEGKFMNGKYYIYNIQIEKQDLELRWMLLKSCFDLFTRFFGGSNIFLIDLLQQVDQEDKYMVCCNDGYYL